MHSQIVHEEGKEKVVVHFERPTDNGFDEARCELSDCHWLYIEGYTDAEIQLFETFLKSNAHLLYKYAASGGVNIA